MEDSKLLEFAGHAAGETYNQENNPLERDDLALRLAVKCGISVLQFPASIGIAWPQNGLPARLIGTAPPYEDISSGQDPYAATRRAIVRAAAEIGRGMA